MTKITYVEDGKPTVGIGIEYEDWEQLRTNKKSFIFEIGGKTVNIAYIGSKKELAEKISKLGLKLTIDGNINATRPSSNQEESKSTSS